MATQITSDNFEQYFLSTQEKYADSLEQAEGARGASVVTDLDTMKRTLVIPGVNYDQDPVSNPNAQAQDYVQIPYSVLADTLEAMEGAAEDAEEALDSLAAALAQAGSDHTRAELDHGTAADDHVQAGTDHTQAGSDHGTATDDHARAGTDHTQAGTDHATAQSDHTQAGTDHATAQSDHTQAGTDHTRAETDHRNVQGAENVNAQLAGFTVTITDRQGVSRSVDIGFEIYRTYASVAAMDADAANVPQGKFVVIATVSATDPDNAKMYCKNSQGTFTFLCDLDQASSSAWADWLDNQKPLIIQATADANSAALLAGQKAALADTKAALADAKAQYAQTQGDRAKGYSDHPWELRDDGYIWVWDETTETMVRTEKMIIDWDDMSPSQQQAIIDAVLADLVFASVQTCEDLVDELI